MTSTDNGQNSVLLAARAEAAALFAAAARNEEAGPTAQLHCLTAATTLLTPSGPVPATADSTDPDRLIEQALRVLDPELTGVALELRRFDLSPSNTTKMNGSAMRSNSCTWCGVDVDPDDGFRLYEPAGERRAAFCRLEHVVPWAMQGAHWEMGVPPEPRGLDDAAECAHCGQALGDAHVLLVRHRGEYRIPDAFCSVDHLLSWAKAGGRWRS